MYRNLYKRVEILVPVYSDKIKKHLQELIDLQLQDNRKARSLDYKKMNIYHRDDKGILTRSQMETYRYIKRKENK